MENETKCDECGAKLTDTPNGNVCVNVGACVTAANAATRRAPGETVRARLAPRAFTISGGVD